MSINNWSHQIANTLAYNTLFESPCVLDGYDSLNNLAIMLSVRNIEDVFSPAGATDISQMFSSAVALPIPINILSQADELQVYPILEVVNVSLDNKLSAGLNVKGKSIRPVIYINCGSIELKEEMHEDFTCYDGYTEIDIFLPYYGFISVAPSDIFIFKYLYFRMSLNTISGDATYYILGSNEEIADWVYMADCEDVYHSMFLLTSVNCNIGYNIPLVSTNDFEVIRNRLLQGAVNAFKIASSVYVGSPAGAIPAGGYTTKTVVTNRLMKDKSSPTGKSMQEWQRRTTTVYNDTPVSDKEMRQYRADQISEVFDATMSAVSGRYKTQNVSSGITGTDMLFTSTSIHFIMRRPLVKEQGAQFNHLFGKPLGETRLLSTLSGYTKISNIHFDSTLLSTATEEEKAMLKEACLQGIYL